MKAGTVAYHNNNCLRLLQALIKTCNSLKRTKSLNCSHGVFQPNLSQLESCYVKIFISISSITLYFKGTLYIYVNRRIIYSIQTRRFCHYNRHTHSLFSRQSLEYCHLLIPGLLFRSNMQFYLQSLDRVSFMND